MNRSAFSLVELVMVVAIIAVVAAIAVPRVSSGRTQTRLDAAESAVVGLYEATVERSRMKGGPHAVHFDPASESVKVYWGDAIDARDLVWELDLAASPYTLDLRRTNQPGAGNLVVIDGHGYADLGIIVRLVADGVTWDIRFDAADRGSAQGVGVSGKVLDVELGTEVAIPGKLSG